MRIEIDSENWMVYFVSEQVILVCSHIGIHSSYGEMKDEEKEVAYLIL